MNAIDCACLDHTARVEEGAIEFGCDLLISGGEADATLIGAAEFFSCVALWRNDLRRADDKDRRNGHGRLDGSLADSLHQGRDALRCCPGVVVRMRELEV